MKKPTRENPKSPLRGGHLRENTGMKGINDSCREVLETKVEKNLCTRHIFGCLRSS